MFGIAAFIGFGFVATSHASQCAFDTKEETCFGGTTMSKVSAKSVDECCAACQAEPACTHFTFTVGASTCGLKSGSPVKTKHIHCTSGVRQGPSPTPPSPVPTPTPTPTPTPPSPTPTPSPKPGTDALKYPQDVSGKLIIDKDDDGYPNLNLDLFENNAEACPTDTPWGTRVLPCTERTSMLASVSNSSVQKHGNCACGKIGTKVKKGCKMCGLTKIATEDHFSNHRPESLKCPKMTRRQILERAIGWVVTGAAYRDNQDIPETCARNDPNPHCPMYMFQGVCNGFVDMAWYGGGSDCQEKIDCKDMRPGDKIHHKSHSMLWRKFVKDSTGKISHGIMYQMGGGWAKANVATHPNKFTGTCFRRKNLIEDEDDEALASMDDAELVV